MQYCVHAQEMYEISPGTHLWLTLSPVLARNDGYGRLINSLSIHSIFQHTQSHFAKMEDLLMPGT